MSNLDWIPVSIVIVSATIAGATDLWKYRVYNALTFPLVVSGLLYHSVFGVGIGYSALGMLFGFVVLIMPYLLGLMGAGDVKLLAGIGAWLGLTVTAYVFAATALVAGAVSVVLILYRGQLHESWSIIKMILTRFVMAPAHIGKDDFVGVMASGPDRRLRAIPFAAMVPLGLVVTFLCHRSGLI